MGRPGGRLSRKRAIAANQDNEDESDLQPIPRQRRAPFVGAAFGGRRLAMTAYGGVRAFPSTPPSRRSKDNPQATPEHSPGHSSALNMPASGHASEHFATFEVMEDRDAVDPPQSSPFGLERIYDNNPLQFLGEGYAAQLPADTDVISHHARWKILTMQRWRDLVPTLVMPFLRWCEETQYGRVGRPPRDPQTCTCNVLARNVCVSAVYGERIEKLRLTYCDCQPLALTLMELGLFPGSPVRPAFAFDINHLLWASIFFVNGVPNITAWTAALTQYLAQKGYEVPSTESLRKPFSKALQHFQLVQQRADELTRNVVEACRQEGNPMSRISLLTSEVVEEMSRDPAATSYYVKDEDHQPTASDAAPSAYLRSRCSLCFPSKPERDPNKHFDSIQCLDACFQQVRCRGTASDDIEIDLVRTYFLSPADIVKAKQHVENRRARKSTKGKTAQSTDDLTAEDRLEPGMRIPDSVLDGCERSFLAADENREKASTSAFADTGLMAMLCRHDRVLFMANVTTAGEKQYYAVALLHALFHELPAWWKAGILYDIGCNLHRSTVKWNLMPQISHRIEWGISVFHAFGHQWPCQCVYHPQKREGFGLSDGEGCERCWGALKKLISICRVSGHQRRLFLINFQIMHMDDISMQHIGTWLINHLVRAVTRQGEAQERVDACGLSLVTLRLSWADQVAAQAKPLPVASKNLVGRFVNNLLTMIESQATTQSTMKRIIDELAALPDNENSSDRRLDLLIQQADLESSLARLSARIKKGVQQLMDKDKACARTLRKAQGDAFLALRLQARALKQRVRARVQERRFESEHLERAYFRASLDHKAHAQTADAIKRRSPGIKKLARRYNEICARLGDMKQRSATHSKKQIPKELEIDQLFNIDLDESIWEDAGLDLEDGETPPAWLADEATREGIKAMHILDRAGEELLRLQHEFRALVLWLSEELDAVKSAKICCEDAALLYQLSKQEKQLRSLGVSWWTVLQKVQLGRDLAWPEYLQGLGDGRNEEAENEEYDPDGEEGSQVGMQELYPEDTEVDDYLVEYILQSHRHDGGEEDVVDSDLDSN